MEGVVVQNEEQVLTPPRSRANNQFPRYEKNNKGNYLENMRGSLMVVATVIASLTFQIAINPPGGVWQTDPKLGEGCALNKTCKAGTSILAFSNTTGSETFFPFNQKYFDQTHRYEAFILLCTISFSVSQATIVFLISGFPLGNKFFRWLLIIATCVSVLCTGGAYAISMSMILLDPLNKTISRIIIGYAIFWVALILLLVFIFFCRFVFWLLKLFFRFISRCLRWVDHELC